MSPKSFDMMTAVNSNMEKIFGAPSTNKIAAATVYIERLPNNNRTFRTRYWGKDKELVIQRVRKALGALDQMSSPSSSPPALVAGNWEIIITWYSVD